MGSAPRVTIPELQAEIASEHYFTAEEGMRGTPESLETYRDNGGVPYDHKALSLLTFCVLVLRNGFTVTGESACVSAANFNRDMGREIARKNAVEKLWPLLGFRLADKLAAQAHAETVVASIDLGPVQVVDLRD